jgi:hypothetical protein
MAHDVTASMGNAAASRLRNTEDQKLLERRISAGLGIPARIRMSGNSPID